METLINWFLDFAVAVVIGCTVGLLLMVVCEAIEAIGRYRKRSLS